MSKVKRGLGDVEYAGKVKTQTFKQYQQELLIKSKVMPASKLAETAKRNATQTVWWGSRVRGQEWKKGGKWNIL